MSHHRRAVAWAAACSAVVLAVGACVPMWERTKWRDGWDAGHEEVSGWVWLATWVRGSTDDSEARGDNRKTSVRLLGVAGLVYGVVYLACRRRTRLREAGTFSDGPGGSIPDGRESRTTGGPTTSPRTGSP
jgi:hypothetical protein